jgi:hypothetical protein
MGQRHKLGEKTAYLTQMLEQHNGHIFHHFFFFCFFCFCFFLFVVLFLFFLFSCIAANTVKRLRTTPANIHPISISTRWPKSGAYGGLYPQGCGTPPIAPAKPLLEAGGYMPLFESSYKVGNFGSVFIDQFAKHAVLEFGHRTRRSRETHVFTVGRRMVPT